MADLTDARHRMKKDRQKRYREKKKSVTNSVVIRGSNMIDLPQLGG
jgi:small nuclear ribonucleoprotein (snRNP)-like protein